MKVSFLCRLTLPHSKRQYLQVIDTQKHPNIGTSMQPLAMGSKFNETYYVH